MADVTHFIEPVRAAGPARQRARLTRRMERVVAGENFAELLSRLVKAIVALHRGSSGGLDLLVRHLRLAGRQDLTRLGRQMARAEDKLEVVLQQVEALDAAPRELPAQEPGTAVAPGSARRSVWRPALAGASVVAVPLGGALVAMHPPSIVGAEEALALAVAVVALIAVTARATLALASRRGGRS